MKKNILIISNPFGFGPTGEAISFANTLMRSNSYSVILFVDNFTSEIKDKKIKNYIKCDLRNEDDLRNAISKIDKPYVLSFQNRFAIKAAKKLKIPNAFIDGLIWLWDPIPKEHLLADILYWPKLPWHEPPKNKKAINVSPIVGDIGKYRLIPKEKGKIMFYIGGIKNPLYKKFPLGYVTIVANIINFLYENYPNILVTSDSKTLEKMKGLINANIKRGYYEKENFLKEIASSEVFISNGGENAVLEAVYLGTKISFILPYNLSQLKFIKKFSENKLLKSIPDWNNYIGINLDKYNQEKEFLHKINQILNLKINDKEHLKEYSKETQIINNAKNINLSYFFKNNVEGSKEILNDILKKWFKNDQS